jgi:hypothetical protein
MPFRIQPRSIVRGPFEIMLVGAIMLVAGVVRFVVLHYLSWLHIFLCLSSIAATLLLFVLANYLWRYTRAGFFVTLSAVLVLAILNPAFCLGAGLAVLIMIVTKWP